MRKRNFLWSMLIAITTMMTCVAMTACNNDEGDDSEATNKDDGFDNKKNVGVNNVFGDYLLSNVEYTYKIGYGYTYNYVLSYENNKLVKITEYSGNNKDYYTFDYSKVNDNKVTLTYNGDNSHYDIEMILNEQGFVSKSYHSNGDWYEFTYNKDKRLDCMKQHYYNFQSSYEQITTMTYTNGDLVKVERGYEESYQIAYTSSTVTTPIENIANLMYNCDNLWGIDLDEYNYVYMAGLLGVAPAHLPVTTTRYDGHTWEIKWKLNEKGIPTECASGNYDYYKYYWNANAANKNEK